MSSLRESELPEPESQCIFGRFFSQSLISRWNLQFHFDVKLLNVSRYEIIIIIFIHWFTARKRQNIIYNLKQSVSLQEKEIWKNFPRTFFAYWVLKFRVLMSRRSQEVFG